MTSEEIISKYKLVIERQTAGDGSIVCRVIRDENVIGMPPADNLDGWLQTFDAVQRKIQKPDSES
jgi:hypothetical protein